MPAFLDAHLGLISQLAQGTYFSPRCTNMLFQVRGLSSWHSGSVGGEGGKAKGLGRCSDGAPQHLRTARHVVNTNAVPFPGP